SLQVMRLAATTPDTLGVKVRLVPGTCSLNRSPSRIWPSIPRTVEFQRGKPVASVKRLQTISAFALILICTAQLIEKALLVDVNRDGLGSGVMTVPRPGLIRPRSRSAESRHSGSESGS